MRTDRYRFTRWGAQGTELYDHQNDAGETINIARTRRKRGAGGDVGKTTGGGDSRREGLKKEFGKGKAQSVSDSSRSHSAKHRKILIYLSRNSRYSCFSLLPPPRTSRITHRAPALSRGHSVFLKFSPANGKLLSIRTPLLFSLTLTLSRREKELRIGEFSGDELPFKLVRRTFILRKVIPSPSGRGLG